MLTKRPGQLVEGMSPMLTDLLTSMLRCCVSRVADYDFIFADDERESNPAFLQAPSDGPRLGTGEKGGHWINYVVGWYRTYYFLVICRNPPERSDMPMEEDDRSDVSSHHAGE